MPRSCENSIAPDMPSPKPDLVWLEPGFALGSKPYEYQRRAVAQLGIRAIVAVHAPTNGEAVAWERYGICLYGVPTRDWVRIPITNFDCVVECIRACLEAATPVLLHCLAGINRAPAFAAAVLCQTRGMDVDNALAAVKRLRTAAKPTPEQEDSLRFWYRMRCNQSPEKMKK